MSFKPKKYCFFISPHLDDVVLSCGGYLTCLSNKDHQVNIITVFSNAESSKHSKHAKKYLKHSGFNPNLTSPSSFFQYRRKEDTQALKIIGLKGSYLNFSDALWRRNNLVKLLFLYPNHKAIFLAKIHQQDQLLINKLSKILKNKLAKYPAQNTTIFAPIGIGGHVDHLIINQVIKLFEKTHQVIYWDDFPYNLRSHQEMYTYYQPVLKYNGNSATKVKMIKKYNSQLTPLFGSPSHIPLVYEKFFIHK